MTQFAAAVVPTPPRLMLLAKLLFLPTLDSLAGVGSACTLSFSRLAQHSLALRPAHSRCHQFVTRYSKGFSHFVTSMTAPVASGWSDGRVGLAPSEKKRRLTTAHTRSGHRVRNYSVFPSGALSKREKVTGRSFDRKSARRGGEIALQTAGSESDSPSIAIRATLLTTVSGHPGYLG